MDFTSIPHQFLAWGTRTPHKVAYAVRAGDGWETTDWATYVEQVRLAARGFLALGLDPGRTVGIMGFNRPEWTISDLAAMCGGGVPVGVYNTCATDQVAYILNHAGAQVVVVDAGDPLEKVLAARDRIPDLKQVVVMNTQDSSPEWINWDELIARGRAESDEQLDARLAAIRPEDLGTLIYTSGTTGPPKGSMLTHGNLAAATVMGGELLPRPMEEDARLLSYLPMAHAAERSLTLLGPAGFGYAVYYAESIEQMAANLKEVRPDVFLGVPRVWEKIHAALTKQLDAATGTKATIASWARGVGSEVNRLRCEGSTPGAWLNLQYGLASKLLFSRIRGALGLSRAQALLSGAAPLSREVLEDLASLDLPIREVYGQTETSGPTSNNRPGETRFGSVGRPFHGVEVRIAEDGEILVRGPNVFAGYFKDAEGTGQILMDGWLHSGDMGHLDQDGFLYVTGRKKEILITAGGKNVSPRNIEEAIKSHPLVQEAVVIGDKRRFLSALVAIDPDATVTREVAQGIVWDHVQEVNGGLSSVERIKKIALLPGVLSVEGGELTPTLKLRRSVIAEKYSEQIEAMYV